MFNPQVSLTLFLRTFFLVRQGRLEGPELSPFGFIFMGFTIVS